MMNWIDKKLNMVTMYRLVLYYLMGLLVCAVILGYFGLLPYTPLALVFETILITWFCFLTNKIFSKVFEAPTNIESVYITALILVFLIAPLKSFGDMAFYSLALWASVFAMASKYMFAIKKKHIFNPAAIALVVTSLFIGGSASWWIGTPWMMVPVFVGGFLLTRKLIRWDLVWSFFVAVIAVMLFSHLTGGSIFTDLQRLTMSSPLFFFAFVMLTEPLTAPPTKALRIMYGLIVGFFFAPATHIGSIYFTPEMALVIGNLFAYTVSPKDKLVLKLNQLKEIAKDTYDFVFVPNKPITYKPGQYMEWTYDHPSPDNRGNRRYFTLASSPTEPNLRIGLKFYPNMSTYKRNILRMGQSNTVVASQRAGDFTMPKDKKQKLVFIAGGIGITPFRSMLKYLVDKKEKRDIVLFYSNKKLEDVAYTDVFDEALEVLGVPTIYSLSDLPTIPPTWLGERGFIDARMIQKYTPDFKDRMFYISGPHAMVSTFETMLRNMGVEGSSIKTDFFPGFV
jgi:ferredoxin-NADP reductase/Na+-translocating ferredoxin:NAD+ oxidoreductase RnfD subunit